MSTPFFVHAVQWSRWCDFVVRFLSSLIAESGGRYFFFRACTPPDDAAPSASRFVCDSFPSCSRLCASSASGAREIFACCGFLTYRCCAVRVPFIVPVRKCVREKLRGTVSHSLRRFWFRFSSVKKGPPRWLLLSQHVRRLLASLDQVRLSAVTSARRPFVCRLLRALVLSGVFCCTWV